MNPKQWEMHKKLINLWRWEKRVEADLKIVVDNYIRMDLYLGSGGDQALLDAYADRMLAALCAKHGKPPKTW